MRPMRRLLIALSLLFIAATVEAVPIHPNTVSVDFVATTFSQPLPDHVIFQMVDGIFGASPSTGFFGGLAGYLGLDGPAPPPITTPIAISIDATVRLWNTDAPNLVWTSPAVFHTTLYGDGSSIAVFPPPGALFFGGASPIYIADPFTTRAMSWDSHVPQTVEAIDITAVPEPTSLLLLGSGLIAFRRRRSQP